MNCEKLLRKMLDPVWTDSRQNEQQIPIRTHMTYGEVEVVDLENRESFYNDLVKAGG